MGVGVVLRFLLHIVCVAFWRLLCSIGVRMGIIGLGGLELMFS